MNEEIRDMIGKALHDEPRLEVDRAAVLRAGRRRLRLRRAGLAGGAALAVLAVVSASVLAGRLEQEPDLGGATQPTTAAPDSTQWRQGCVSLAGAGDTHEPAEEVAGPEALAESARLTVAFAEFTFPPGITVKPRPVRVCAFGPGWRATFRVWSGGADRSILLDVRPRDGAGPEECGTVVEGVECRTEPMSDGTVVRLLSTSWADTPLDVTAWRPDGTVVNLMAPTGALPDDVVIALVTAPQLRTEVTGPAPREASDERATELTTILAAGDPLPAGMQALPVPDARAGALDLYVSQGGYKLHADLVDAAGEGNLLANLNTGVEGTTVACDGTPNCTTTALEDGSAATVRTDTTGGVTRLTLITVRPSGIQVMLMSSNVSARSTPPGKNAPATGPTRAEPPLDLTALGRVAMLF